MTFTICIPRVNRDIKKDKTVLEIGPGYGNLTKAIANMHPKKIYAVDSEIFGQF